MTSWIRAPLLKRAEQKSSFFFETTDSTGFCSNFNQFLYAYAYARADGKPLNVYDMANPVGITYPLIKNTFADMSGVVFVDSMIPSASSIKRLLPRVLSTVTAMPANTLRLVAQEVFQWNPVLIQSLQEIIVGAKLPKSFDLGIHIVADRVGVRATPVDEYIRAAKKIQTAAKKDALNVFVMSDSSTALEQFKKKADASWRIYSIDGPGARTDGRNPVRARLAAYEHNMAELLVMQSINDIICMLSNDVGKFIYLTVEHGERVVSLDSSKFTVY
jgi:hypothetical protein